MSFSLCCKKKHLGRNTEGRRFAAMLEKYGSVSSIPTKQLYALPAHGKDLVRRQILKSAAIRLQNLLEASDIPPASKTIDAIADYLEFSPELNEDQARMIDNAIYSESIFLGVVEMARLNNELDPVTLYRILEDTHELYRFHDSVQNKSYYVE
jgi:hypothetical protein